MNVEAAELVVLMKTSNGNIQKEGMALSSDLVNEEPFKIGDHVVFQHDGALGIVLNVRQHKCHVMWEDHFVSWETFELLKKKSATPRISK